MSAVEDRLIDRSAGYELSTGDEISLEATRHLFIAACLLDPARKRDIGLRRGGEELDNKCLRRTNGLLPRCTFTPMEFWGQQLPRELFPEGVRPYKLKGEAVNEPPPPAGLVRGINPRMLNSDLFFMPLFPGDLITDAVGIASGERRGVVEIETLRGIDYGTYDREMEALFFPPEWIVPTPLRLIRERIESVAMQVADNDVHSIAENLLASVDQSVEYMTERVGMETTQNAMRVHPAGHVYRYSPKVRWFAEQLEIKLADVGAAVATKVEQVIGSIDQEALARMNAENIAQVGELFRGVLEMALKGKTAEVQEPAKPTKAK